MVENLPFEVTRYTTPCQKKSFIFHVSIYAFSRLIYVAKVFKIYWHHWKREVYNNILCFHFLAGDVESCWECRFEHGEKKAESVH